MNVISKLIKFFVIILLLSSQFAVVSYGGFFEKDMLVDIKNTFQQQKQALNEFKIDELKSLYTENYSSNDGHNKENLMNLLQDTWKNHPDIKYDMSITKVSLNGDYATVRAISNTTATTAEPSDVTKDTGKLNVDSETIFYVKRVGKSWKIYAEQTLSEKITLLYGECKNMDLRFSAPEMIRANTEYTATLLIPPSQAKFAMGAIKNELITYPEVESKDIFRSVDTSGTLERVLVSNNALHNETASAYVAFTEPYFDKSNTPGLRVSGLALLMQRVNVIPNNCKTLITNNGKNE